MIAFEDFLLLLGKFIFLLKDNINYFPLITASSEKPAPRRTDVTVHSVSIAWLPFWPINWENGVVQRHMTIETFSDHQDGFLRKR